MALAQRVGRARYRSPLAENELHRRIHRVSSEPGAVNGESARQRVVDLESDHHLACPRRLGERRRRKRNAKQLAVRAGIAKEAIALLRVPGENATVVGRVVGQRIERPVTSAFAGRRILASALRI